MQSTYIGLPPLTTCPVCRVADGIYTHRQSLKRDPFKAYRRIGSYFYGWRLGVVASVVRRMNEVSVHWARLVLGWVTVFGRVYHHGVTSELG